MRLHRGSLLRETLLFHTLVLFFIELLIRPEDQIEQLRRVLRMGGQAAEAAAEPGVFAADDDPAELFVHQIELFAEADIITGTGNNQEFIAAVTIDVLLGKMLRQNRRERLEYIVAHQVTVGIVDHLKVIDVSDRQTDIYADIVGDLLIQGITVLQARHAVVVRDDLERLVEMDRGILLLNMLDGQRVIYDHADRRNHRHHKIVIRLNHIGDQSVQPEEICRIRAQNQDGGHQRSEPEEDDHQQLDGIKGDDLLMIQVGMNRSHHAPQEEQHGIDDTKRLDRLGILVDDVFSAAEAQGDEKSEQT